MEEAAIREPGITVRYIDGCSNWRRTYQLLHKLLATAGHEHTTVGLERVETPEDAERLRFVGSPTILLDGRDPFEANGKYGVSCRIYWTPDGPSGSPTKDQLREVLAVYLNDA